MEQAGCLWKEERDKKDIELNFKIGPSKEDQG